MIIKAIYDKQECYLNTDYVVDIFPKGDKFIAYTLDNCRGGYIITKEDLEKLRSDQNDTD